MAQRILVVEDEPDLLALVRINLEQAGFEVETAENGNDALAALRRAPPDLMILDLMLPDVPGTEICRRVRGSAELSELPVIMLTAKADEVDRVVGLELGADDYVTKPFSPRELAPTPARVIEHGTLSLDPERHRCFVDGEEVGLTAKEFSLLQCLMRRPGRVMTRDRLLDDVWGSDITVTTRTIDTHLKRLREKLGRAGDLIETVRGVGYRFAE
jgi:two-component system phosphate regulon response regulator PhoB